MRSLQERHLLAEMRASAIRAREHMSIERYPYKNFAMYSRLAESSLRTAIDYRRMARNQNLPELFKRMEGRV